MNHLSETIQNHIRANWPMLCFLQPNSPRIEFWFSHGQNLKNLSTGPQFYIQEFNPDKPIQIWSGHSFDCLQIDLSEVEQYFSEKHPEFIDLWSAPIQNHHRLVYESLVQEAVDSINRGEMSKVVLSRAHDFHAHEVNWLYLLLRLFNTDQKAFRYLMVHPDFGIWCGATPELLISSNQHNYSTMALAGTRWLEGEEFPQWTEKEYEEHNWVVSEILNTLEPFASVSQGQTHEHQAGFVQHLRTDLGGNIRESFNVSSITDHGTGAQSVNMTNAMVDSSYCVLITGAAVGSVDYQTPLNSITNSSTFRIYTSNGTTLTDTGTVCCSVFR